MAWALFFFFFFFDRQEKHVLRSAKKRAHPMYTDNIHKTSQSKHQTKTRLAYKDRAKLTTRKSIYEIQNRGDFIESWDHSKSEQLKYSSNH